MKSRLIYILSLLFIHSSVFLFAQIDPVKIEDYSYKEGLTTSGVNSVFKDSKGFLWICTNNGLFRYDGHNFKNINHFVDGFLKYETLCVAEDKYKNLWIGTAGKGIAYYNTHSGRLSNLNLSVGNNSKIYRILFFRNKVWIASNTGLLIIDDLENGFENHDLKVKTLLPDPSNRNPQMNVINFIYARPGSESLWVGTNSQLCELNTQTLSFQIINSFNQNSIRWLADYYDKIIVASWDGGVFAVNPKNSKVENDWFITEINKIVGDKRVKSVLLDNKNRCWVATFSDGLYVFSMKREGEPEYQNYSNDKTKPARLKSNFVEQIYLDHDGIVWLSLPNAGLSKVYFQNNNLHSFDFHKVIDETKSKEILGLARSTDQNKFWVYFNENELALFNTKDFNYKIYNKSRGELQLQNDKISLVYQDKLGNLWIVYSRIGLFVVPGQEANKLVNGNLNTNITPLDANALLSADSRANSYITTFFEDSKGRLWIEGWGAVYLLDFSKGFPGIVTSEQVVNNCKSYLIYSDEQRVKYNFPISPINSIVELGNNRFWLGTRDAGIVQLEEISPFSFKGSEIKLNDKLPSNLIKCLFNDKDNNLWIGTNSGLCNILNDSLKIIGAKDGLSSENINNIIEDENHNLWISTSYGISKLNTKNFSVGNYFHEDKEKLNQYITNAAVWANGKIWFSTDESLVMLKPDSMEISVINGEIYFTDIKINNNTVVPNQKYNDKLIIISDLNETKEINVPYGSILNLEFASLDYNNTERLTYKYKIDNNEWIMLNPGQRSLTLPNLNPGEYTLSLKLSDSRLENNVRSVRIIYLPPFWLSRIAYLIYFIIILSLVLIYRRLTIQKIHQKSEIERERYEIKKLEELDKMKSEFFSNISHELRTPLSLIINPLEKLVEEKDISPRCKSKINLVLKSSNRLLRLTNELMDFSKIEKKLLVPEFQLCEIVAFVEDICQLFNNLSDAMNIDYKVNNSVEHLEIPIDKGMIEKVIFNLLSNAFKYTPAHGVILVNTGRANNSEKEYVKISVTNTGSGIDKENLTKIFDRYYQVNNPQNRNIEGTGIGLSLVKSFIELHNGKVEVTSVPNLETCFDIYIPVIQDGFGLSEERYKKVIDKDEEAFKFNAYESGNFKSTSHYQLLVVEDDEDIRNYIIEELSPEFKILSAKDGQEALNIANEMIPDLIITDVIMPVLSGIGLCEKLKNQLSTSHIPIIILSAKTSVNQQIEGLEMGADVYMVKPFNIDHLKAQVLRLISFKQEIYSRYLKETTLIPNGSLTNKLDEEFMQKVMSFIEENLTNSNLSVDQLANCVHLSKVQTYRKVKAISGLSAVEFIRTVRLKKAAQLIMEGNLNFSEIAFESGFSTPSYFSKCFHDHFGKTPSEFASKFMNNKEVKQ
ncbi:MAG: two-component regulator propeller domain-containing protein [Bacteroidales bacterium]